MELSHSSGWACKATEDGYGRSREIFQAGKSKSSSIWIKSCVSLLHEAVRLTPCSRLCQAGHVRAGVLHLTWVSSSSPMWMPGQEGPCDISWHIMTHQSTHGNGILIPPFMALFQIGNTSKNGNEYCSDFYDLFQLPLFFSLEKVIVFHRFQQGFWEMQVFFCRGKTVL